MNGSSEEIEPIVLHLLPGEETIFDLRVVNDGEPSNIYLETNRSLKKAVRIKEADHYLTSEKVVPILARMPGGVDRLEGYLSVKCEEKTLKIPFNMIRDDEGDASQAFEAADKQAEESTEAYDDPETDDAVEVYVPDEDRESQPEYVPCYREDPDEEDCEAEGGLDPQEIQRPSYTARSRALRAKREAYWRNGRVYEENNGKDGRFGDSYSQDGYEDGENLRDRSRSRGHRQDGSEGNEDYRNESRGDYYRDGQSGDHRGSEERSVEASDTQYRSQYQESYYDPPEKGRFFLIPSSLGHGCLLLTVPSILFISLIASLMLTFYASVVPELLGALVSSILIVTLIIYGAATLLKA